jgi:hypothetical protein
MRAIYVIFIILSIILSLLSYPLSHYYSAMIILIQLSVPINGAEFTNWDIYYKIIKN